jgi:hypothetical protein
VPSPNEKAPGSLGAGLIMDRKEYKPRFGRLLAVCGLAVVFCGVLVWFASTYLRDCCAP